MKYHPLIFGKNTIENIVGCEVKGSTIDIFTQNKDGTCNTLTRPHKYWLTSTKEVNPSSDKLECKHMYKYLTRFDPREAF